MGDWLPNRLPEDIDAERSLLATVCAPGAGMIAAQCLRRITPDLFMHPAHKAVYEAARGLLEEGLEINALTLKDALDGRKTLNRVGGYPGLVEILAGEDVGRPDTLVDLLLEKQRRRQLVHLGARLVREAVEDTDGSLGLITSMMRDLGMVSRGGRKEEVSSWSEILDMVEGGEAFRDGDGLCGGYWGIPALDEEAPIPAGQVTFVGARPGIGKTALGTQICVESAVKGRVPLYVQLELPLKTTKARVASYFTRTSVRKFKEGAYAPSDIEALRRQSWVLAQGGIIAPRQGTSWPQLEATILEDMDRRGTNTIVIDYFQIIGRPAVGKGSSEAYAFAKVSDSIMAFAKDHQDVGVVLLGQLKTDAANGEPKDGQVADSDRPAKDAAVTLMLWRNSAGAIWSVLHKNRDGAMGWKRELNFEGWSQHFSLATKETTSEATHLLTAACGPDGKRRRREPPPLDL
jgi:replicative DNA helicase